jgi:hypothetical protein
MVMDDGCWVAVQHDVGSHVSAVFADELSARRWAMDHYADVEFLPYGIEINEYLRSQQQPLDREGGRRLFQEKLAQTNPSDRVRAAAGLIDG